MVGKVGQAGEVLFSWLHVSDIHFLHGDERTHLSQREVLDKLIADVSSQLADSKAQPAPPTPDCILLTGDVAFKGAASEYRAADEWLEQLMDVARVSRQNVHIIPGNHDVARTTPAQRQAFRLVSSLRNGSESLDDALTDEADRLVLTQRLENYLLFSSRYGVAAQDPASEIEQWLFWSHHLLARGRLGIRVQLLGLNSAILCNDDDDAGKLRLGAQQVRTITRHRKADTITLLLTHHPLADLADANDPHVRTLLSHCDIHLHGHVHRPASQGTDEGDGRRLVRVVAGAVHESPVGRQQGYSFGGLVEGESGVELTRWPRRWTSDRNRFEVDQDNTLADMPVARHPIAIGPKAKAGRQTATVTNAPVLGPLSGYDARPSLDPGWVLEPEDARRRLARLGLNDPARLFAGTIRPIDQPHAVVGPEDELKAGAVHAVIEWAVHRQSRFVLFSGLRGVGKSTLLLRYVASLAPPDESRIFVDCTTHDPSRLDEAHRELEAFIKRTPDSSALLVIVVDGLDISCRDQVVRGHELTAGQILKSAVRFLRRHVESLTRRPICMVFSSDVPPEWLQEVAAAPSWATDAFQEIITEWLGVHYRFELPDGEGNLSVLRHILPSADTDALWQRHPVLRLPVFADAVSDTSFQTFAALTTRRQLLSQGANRRGVPARERHTYYRALTHLNQLFEALNALPASPATDERHASMALLEAELTGDWLYLLELADDEAGIVSRLQELHTWVTEDGWRYSHTFALSNLVSILSVLGKFAPRDFTYAHCNLRKAQIFNNARINDTVFHGADLEGARIQQASVSNGRFYGVNFTGAQIDQTTFDVSCRFVGCRLDRSLVGSAIPPEQLVEPVFN